MSKWVDGDMEIGKCRGQPMGLKGFKKFKTNSSIITSELMQMLCVIDQNSAMSDLYMTSEDQGRLTIFHGTIPQGSGRVNPWVFSRVKTLELMD